MGLADFRNQLRMNPPILPDALWLAYNSIGRAAGAAINPNDQPVLQAWIDELNRYVAANGKFQKFEVIYVPLGPPPLFWNYACFKCLAYIDPNACQWVEGVVGKRAWCTCWLPQVSYKALTWPKDLLAGSW